MTKQKHLIVLEGLPGSGKTTHLKLLSRYSDTTVHEILHKIPKKSNESFYLDNDIEKYMRISPNGLTIMDRNYVSTLAYNFSKLSDWDFTFFSVLWWYIYNKINGRIWEPSFYIYIRTPVHLGIKRKIRPVLHPFWSDPTKLKLMGIFYNVFFVLVERRVKRIDGREAIESQNKQILSFLKEKDIIS